MNRSRLAEDTALHSRNSRHAMPARRSNVSLSLVVGRDRRDSSDGDLARGLMAGEAWAIAETWQRFAPMVIMMAERCLGSRSEAEDIGQEVFYRVFRKAKTLRDPDSLRSFVYSFAVRALRTELRRKKLRSWLTFDQPEALVDVGSRTLDVESRDLLRKFHGLLDRLTPRDRLVFGLRRMESMTVEEIATYMDVSVSTVKRSMTHASSRLSRWIDADPGLAGLLDGKRWGR
jgi:RNA polymerase sigma-70 factor, ECF subfamily